MVSQKVSIKNPTGLHLRPAGIFCKMAMQFTSKITVETSNRGDLVIANAKSVLSILGAAIKAGDEILIVCDGVDEVLALESMITIVQNGLGE